MIYKPQNIIRSIYMVLVALVLVVTVIGYAKANAAYNPQINYQGKLTNASNVAVTDGNYSVKFKLYTTINGGSPIWTETWCDTSTCDGLGSGADNRIRVTNGLFSTMLGSTTAFTGIDFNQPLYLSLEIGGSAASTTWDGEMSPRKILGTVPSAFTAGTSTYAVTSATSTFAQNSATATEALSADTLQNITPGQFLRSDVQNSTSTATTFLSVLQSGAGKVAEFFGGASKTVLSILSGGNIGIGTSTPGAKLAISANAGDTNTSLFQISSTTAANATTTLFNIDNTGSTTAANGFNATAGCYAINGSCIGGSNLTGAGTANMLTYWTGTGALSATSAPTVGYITATSTTATSSIGGFLSVFGTNSTSTIFGALNVAGASGLNIFQNGNVSVGTSTSWATLAVSGVNGNKFSVGTPQNNLTTVFNAGGISSVPSYSNSGGQGNRTSIITVTSSFGAWSDLVNGNRGDFTIYEGGGNAAGQYITFDFGVGVQKYITEATFYNQGPPNLGTWQWQGSNDGTNYTNIGSTFTMAANTTDVETSLSANTAGYRYYRALGISGTMAAMHPFEFEFKIDNFTTSNYASLQDYISDGATTGGVIALQKDAGYVGIGETGPVSKLAVLGNVAVGDTSYSKIAAPANGMIVQGKVGIGTTSPYAPLSVNGQIVGSYFTATTTTATSTFGGFLSVLGATTSTSTFTGGLAANQFNSTGSATSTFAQGINLTAGCFAVGNNCLQPLSGGNVNMMTYWTGTGALSATSAPTVGYITATTTTATSTFAGGITQGGGALVFGTFGLTGHPDKGGYNSTKVVTSNPELYFAQTGDTYGTTYMRLGDRTGLNGVTFGESGVGVTDFNFQNGATTTQGQIRMETRACYYTSCIAVPEFQIGKTDTGAGGPTLDIPLDGTKRANFAGVLGIMNNNPLYALDMKGDQNIAAGGSIRFGGTTALQSTTTGTSTIPGFLSITGTLSTSSFLGFLYANNAGFNTFAVGTVATTTIQGVTTGTSSFQGYINVLGANTSTSTFSGALSVNRLNISGAGTSTVLNNLDVLGTLHGNNLYSGDLIFANNIRFTEAPLDKSPQGLLLNNQNGDNMLSIDEGGNLSVAGDICSGGNNCFGKSLAFLTKTVSQLASSTDISLKLSRGNTAVSLSQLSSSVADANGQISDLNAKVNDLTINLGNVSANAVNSLMASSGALDILASTTAVKLTSNSTFIAQIASAVKDMIQSVGSWAVDQLTARMVFADRIETKVAAVSQGLEMTDQATGQIYCVAIRNGDWAKNPGACGTVSTTNQVTIQTASSTTNGQQTASVVTIVPTVAEDNSSAGVSSNLAVANTGTNTGTSTASSSAIAVNEVSSPTNSTTTSTTIETAPGVVVTTTGNAGSSTTTVTSTEGSVSTTQVVAPTPAVTTPVTNDSSVTTAVAQTSSSDSSVTVTP